MTNQETVRIIIISTFILFVVIKMLIPLIRDIIGSLTVDRTHVFFTPDEVRTLREKATRLNRLVKFTKEE